jgi:hypothetical protein
LATHPLRGHPLFRPATPEERGLASEQVVTFIGGPAWIPAGSASRRHSTVDRRRAIVLAAVTDGIVPERLRLVGG